MKPRTHFFLTVYGLKIWLPILLGGVVLLAVVMLIPGWGWLGWPIGLLMFAGLAFFRDFSRRIPEGDGIMVAPADGTVTDVSLIDHYGALGGPAVKIGIFLSVLSVHVNRSPCAGRVLAIEFTPGEFLDARHPECGLRNQSNTIVLGDAEGKPVAVVKQIVGAIARRIICPLEVGDALARGERFGMIAFGSRTELYVPANDWEVAVKVRQGIRGGINVVLRRKKGSA